jgi:hypothetical protein
VAQFSFSWDILKNVVLKGGTVAYNVCLALGLKILKIQIFMIILTNFKEKMTA